MILNKDFSGKVQTGRQQSGMRNEKIVLLRQTLVKVRRWHTTCLSDGIFAGPCQLAVVRVRSLFGAFLDVPEKGSRGELK